MPIYPQEPTIESTTLADAGGINLASVSAGGAVKVDGSAVIQPVSQSGTWTVQPGNTANTTPWLVEPRLGTLATYSAAITGLTVALLATDIFTLTGSGTKTVKVTRVEVTGTENTAAIRDVLLIKRSSANSGGTSTTPAAVPHDSNNAAATAVARAYTVNPTTGTTVGTVRVRKVDIEATNLVGASDSVVWDFGDKTQPLILRGTGEVIAVNLNAVTVSNNSFDISITWTEE